MAYILGTKQAVQPWGNVLGTALGEGISQLAQAKLHKMQEAQNVQRFTAAGIDPVSARFIAQLPPERQFEAASTYLQEQPAQQQQQQQYSPMQQLQQMPTAQEAAPEGLSSRLAEPSRAASPESMLAPFGSPVAPEILGKAFKQPKAAPGGQAPQMQPEMAAPSQPPAQKTPQQLLGRALMSKEQRKEALVREREGRKEALAQEKQSKHEQEVANKETKKFYDDMLAVDDAAKKSDMRLNKMENLVKKGSLPFSGFYRVIKSLEEITPTTGATAGAAIGAGLGALGAGIPSLGIAAPVGGVAGAIPGGVLGGAIGALVSPVSTILSWAQRGITSRDTEQFEKLSNDFIREAKSIFGARITNQDLNTFLAMIPTLAQTDQGKLAVINNMRNFNKAQHVKSKVMKQIIKENNGNRPMDLAIRVEERAQAELDKIAQEFEHVTDRAEKVYEKSAKKSPSPFLPAALQK